MVPMAPFDKSPSHSSQVLMRCSLQMVYQSTEELTIRANGMIGEGVLTNGICLCILDISEFVLVQPNMGECHVKRQTRQ